MVRVAEISPIRFGGKLPQGGGEVPVNTIAWYILSTDCAVPGGSRHCRRSPQRTSRQYALLRRASSSCRRLPNTVEASRIGVGQISFWLVARDDRFSKMLRYAAYSTQGPPADGIPPRSNLRHEGSHIAAPMSPAFRSSALVGIESPGAGPASSRRISSGNKYRRRTHRILSGKVGVPRRLKYRSFVGENTQSPRENGQLRGTTDRVAG